MMKKILLFAIIIVALFSWKTASAQDISISYQNPTSLNVCESGIFEITLSNDNVAASQVNIIVQLPLGLEYVLGTVQNAVESPNLLLNNPGFQIASLDANKEITITFEARVLCSAINEINSGVLFSNIISINYNGNSESITTNPYRIETPLLILESVTPSSLQGTQYDIVNRTIRIKNTRLGRVSEIKYSDLYSGGISIQTSLSDGQTVGNLYSGTIGAAEFRTVGNGDDYLDQDEVYELEEEITITDCGVMSFASSTIRIEWGCFGESCGFDNLPASIRINPNPLAPNLQLSSTSTIPENFCQDEAFKESILIENTGTDTTRNIQIIIDGNLEDNPFAFDLNSFVATSNGSPINADITSLRTYRFFSCNFSGSFSDTLKVLLPDALAPGESIELTFDLYYCAEGCDANAPSYDYFVNYEGTCPPGSTLSSSGSTNTAEDPYFILDSVKFRIGRPLFEGSSYYMDYKVLSKLLTDPDGYFKVNLELPCGMEWGNSPFILDGKTPLSIDVTPQSSSTLVEILFELPFSSDSLQTSFIVEYNCVDTCINLDSPTLVNLQSSCTSPTHVCLGGNCGLGGIISDTIIPAGVLDVFTVNVSSEIIPNLNEPSCAMADCEEFEMYWLCEVDAMVENGRVRGYVNPDGSHLRENVGFADADDNRLADMPLSQADPNMIRRDRFIDGDTSVTKTYGVVTVDDEGATFKNAAFRVIYASFKSDDLRNGASAGFYYKTSGLFREDAFKELDTKVRVVDKSAGKTYEAFIQRNAIKVDQYDKVIIINTRPEELLDEWFYQTREYRLEPENLTNGNFPAAFVLEEGDSIIFEARHIVNFNPVKVGPEVLNLRNIGSISIYDDPSSAEYTFTCGFSEHFLEISGSEFKFGPNPFSISPCTSTQDPTTSYFEYKLGQSNFFPNEVRELLRVKDWDLFFSNIVSHEETWLGSIDLQGGNNLHGFYQYSGLGASSPVSPDLSLFDEPIRDEGFSMLFTHSFTSNDCIFEGVKATALTVRLEFPHNFGLFPNTMDTTTSINSGISTSRPNLTNSLPNNNQVALGSTIGWDSKISNFSNHIASNVFILVGEGENLYNVVVVNKANGDTLRPVNGIIQLGNLNFNQSFDLEIVAQNGGCGGRDSLQMTWGWNCDPWTDPASSQPCDITTVWLKVKTLPAELELDIKSPEEPFQLCDTVPFHTIEVFNANFNPATNLALEVLLPLGLEILPGSCEISYPKGSAFTAIPDPGQISTGLYQWDINSIQPIIANNGLAGYVDAPDNSFLIRFKSLTDCGFVSNSPVIFRVTGKNSNCEVPSNVLAKPGDLLQVEGLDADYTGQFFMSGTQVEEISCGENLFLEVRFRNTGFTGLKDSFFITLPSGANYVMGSYSPQSNAPQGEPTILNRGNYQLLKWQIPANLAPNQLISFNISVANLGSDNCNSANIFIQALQTKEAVCAATGEVCDAKIATGDITLSVNILHPNLDFQNISGEFLDGPNGPLTVDGTIFNQGVMAFNPVVEFYIDNNGNGTVDPGDDRVGSGNLNDIDEGETGSFGLPVNINPKDLCRLIAWLPAEENCMCDPRAIQINTANVSGVDTTICNMERIQLGTSFSPNHSYDWTNWNVLLSCDDCPNPEFQYTNMFDTSRTFVYNLEETFGQCNLSYTFAVTIQPSLAIASNPGSICEGESTELEAEGAAQYQWSGPGVSDPNAQTITVAPMSTSNYYLTLTDSIGCESNDSILVTVNPIPDVDAGPDTTFCARGGSKQIFVAGDPDFSYTWIPANIFLNPNNMNPYLIREEDGTAIVQVTSLDGCINFDTLSFRFVDQPDLKTEEYIQACIGEDISLLVEGAETYEWSPPTGLSCTTCPDPIFTPTENTVYTVSGTNGGICVDTKTVLVEILGSITFDSTDQFFCPGDTIFFGGLALTEPGTYTDTLMHPLTSCDSFFTLNLNFTDQETEESNIICAGDTLNVFGNLVTSPGTICQTFTSSTGCDSTHCVTLTGVQNPDIRLLEYDYVAEMGTTVTVNLEPGFTQYNWTPDSLLSCNNCPTNVITVGADTVNYQVEVFNDQGCSVTIRVNINAVNRCSKDNLKIPNVIYPASTFEENREFGVFGEVGLEQVRLMQIFNSWGEKIYEGFGNGAKWDGTIEGTPVPSDVYFYRIEIGCYDDSELIEGDVTVLR